MTSIRTVALAPLCAEAGTALSRAKICTTWLLFFSLSRRVLRVSTPELESSEKRESSSGLDVVME